MADSWFTNAHTILLWLCAAFLIIGGAIGISIYNSSPVAQRSSYTGYLAWNGFVLALGIILFVVGNGGVLTRCQPTQTKTAYY